MCYYFLGTYGQNKPWCIKIAEEKEETSNHNFVSMEQVSPAVFESRPDPEEELEQKDSIPEVIKSNP